MREPRLDLLPLFALLNSLLERFVSGENVVEELGCLPKERGLVVRAGTDGFADLLLAFTVCSGCQGRF